MEESTVAISSRTSLRMAASSIAGAAGAGAAEVGAAASTDGDFLQLWPHRHGTDAMFAAYLRRR